ncbi:MAG: hypothetical protein PHP08_02145 [Candidatus Dojkabacteria bacterium]|nr:hypothetical protein [Candidatus Dojkabacteria bacterium]
MLLNELGIVNQMLKEKTSGFKYIYELIKLLNPYSWKIFHMRNIDQEEWKRIKTDIDSTMSRKEKDLEEYINIDKIQKLNTQKLKMILKRKGCITISRFGMIASHCAWLIVQHSDNDRVFQKEYLEMMEENKEDIFEENIKSLKRRLRI